MKRIICILFFIISTVFIAVSQYNIKVPISQQIKSYELAIRYLKLGNTYRESGNYIQAKKYIEMGFSLAKRNNRDYWVAVSYEYLGYLYRDQGEIAKAKEYLIKSKDIYNKSVKMKEGSNEAIVSAILELDNGFTKEDKKSNIDVTEISSEIKELKNQIAQNNEQITNLKIQIIALEEQLSIQKLPVKSHENIKTEPIPGRINIKEPETSNKKEISEPLIDSNQVTNAITKGSNNSNDSIPDINSKQVQKKDTNGRKKGILPPPLNNKTNSVIIIKE
jgi:hypothetical protein